MRRRATIPRSSGSATRGKMDASFAYLVLFVAGSALGYNVRREAPYNIGPNDPYPVAVNFQTQEPSQRLFWGNQGSNQVGGTGLWASLTNKFPFLGNMFGRMELPSQYGVPNDVSTQYGVPAAYYGVPGYYNQVPQYQQAPRQLYQQPQFHQNEQSGHRFVSSGRDVGLTDDAVIVTPPFVPIAQPAPAPFPQPAPSPFPQPAPSPVDQGYSYNKPQYRLDLPHK